MKKLNSDQLKWFQYFVKVELKNYSQVIYVKLNKNQDQFLKQ
jgi:hypothetical protein